MKRIIVFSLFLLAAGAALFAGGSPEKDVTGTVTAVEAGTDATELIVTVTTPDGDFRVRFSEEDWTALSLRQGDLITVSGVVIDDDDDDD